MRQVMDGYDAASVLVDAIATVLARHVGRHQAGVPVVGQEDDILSVGEPRGSAASACQSEE